MSQEKKTNGGPAFPRSLDASSGMTLRDHFAALAMQGMGTLKGQVPIDVARRAYIMADALLWARDE